MSRDEIAVLDGSKCVLQLRGVRPFLSDKYDLTQHPNYKYTADFDKRYTFDIEKYLNHASSEDREKLQQLSAELQDVPEVKLNQVAVPVADEKLQQAAAEFPFPAAFAFVPWGHHVEIVSKCKTIEEARFYIRKIISEGWSRSTQAKVPSVEGHNYTPVPVNCVLRRLHAECPTSSWPCLARLPSQGTLRFPCAGFASYPF